MENELKSICEDILETLERHLLPSATTGESKVFYNKMWAFYRLNEVKQWLSFKQEM